MLTCFYNLSSAQIISTALLDTNNISAMVNDNGTLFNNLITNNAGYEFINGSNKHLIYSSGFWFGGKDINNQLKFSGVFYDTSGYFGTGPLTIGSAQPMNPPMEQTIWMISVDEIQYHIEHYQDLNYTINPTIASWPAHGDTSLGFDYNLAPFVDVDADNNYIPSNGDYPCIKGDKAVYMILNDISGNDHSYSQPIGLELHYLIYQFDSNTDVENTTFIDLKVINRGTQTLYNFHTSYFVDGDLGNYMDDYVGCDTSRNLGFYYNADSFDEDNAGHPGFGANPPAFGVLALNNSMDRFSAFPENGFFTANEMYNFMNGYWPDSQPFTDVNGQPTSYYYSGNPMNSGEWSELSAGNQTNDRRFLMTHDENTLIPNQELEYSYAIIIANDSVSPAENVNALYTVADQTKDFFDANLNNSCYVYEAGMVEEEELNFKVKPNPNNGTFEIEIENKIGTIEAVISDLSGRVVFSHNYFQKETIRVNLNETPGLYLLKIHSEGGESIQRIIIE